MGVPRTKDFLLAKKKCIQHRSMCVVLFPLARWLVEGVDDFFKQRSSERAQRKEILYVMAEVF
jgi:hypothetical protein